MIIRGPTPVQNRNRPGQGKRTAGQEDESAHGFPWETSRHTRGPVKIGLSPVNQFNVQLLTLIQDVGD